jgi:cell division protein FtsI (penicillin-binding protein 3)
MSKVRSAQSSEAAFGRRVAAVVLTGLALVFAGLVVRLVYIHVALSPQLLALADQQQQSWTTIPARRGMILDDRGRIFATSRMRYSVFADPGMIEDPAEVGAKLASILEMPAGEIENLIRTSGRPRFCWLKRRVDDPQAEAVRALKLAGVGLQGEFERTWPMHETAAQVIGFVGAEGCGLEGIEALYENHLHGNDGQRSTLRDARRRILGAGREDSTLPADGGHVVLTIDSVVQEIVEARLARQVQEFEAEYGVAIVMSPKTGDVLAMANYPTFDPNNYAAADQSLRRNRTVTDPVEPGSAFKPFVACGALEGGYASTTELIDCHNGLHYFGGRRMHDTKPHGLLTVRDIVVYSSNIGMGELGTRMGNEPLYEVVTRFGFGSPTAIGLRGESAGIVLPTKHWSGYSKTSVPMGQELAVTPLQLATAFCAIANGGELLRPRIVRSLLDAGYRPRQVFAGPQVVRRAVDPEVARYMMEEVLPGVVERGGPRLKVEGYAMGGKSGTAQVPRTDRKGYEPNAYLSTFIGTAPVDDPQIVVLTMIRRPKVSKGYYGATVAGPVVRDIVRSTLQYYQVPEERDDAVADAYP